MASTAIQLLNDTFTLGGAPRKAPPPPDPYAKYCPDAKKFNEWTEKYVIEFILTCPSSEDLPVFIQQAKARLHDNYRIRRQSAPPKHQRYTGDNHICLWHIYEQICDQILRIELHDNLDRAETREQREARVEREKQAKKFGTDNSEDLEELDELILGKKL